jgi:hypothetical protein
MAFGRAADALIVAAINVAMWVLVLVRLRASQKQPAAAGETAPHEGEPARETSASRADYVIRLVALTQILYYAVLLAWLFTPRLADPKLLE